MRIGGMLMGILIPSFVFDLMMVAVTEQAVLEIETIKLEFLLLVNPEVRFASQR